MALQLNMFFRGNLGAELSSEDEKEDVVLSLSIYIVKDKSGNIISLASRKEAEAMIASGVIAGGMIPKVNACLKALKAGTVARIIDGKRPHALLKEVENGDGGTTLVEE